MVEFNGVYRRSGDRMILKQLSFHIREGQVVGLLGANGAGKTTSLKLIATRLVPTRGAVQVAGYDAITNPAAIRQNLGYLPDRPPLYPELRVTEFLRFVGKLRGLSRSKREAGVERVLTQCALRSFAGRLCGSLSRGEQQRVGLAQALLHEPAVILLDEPTSALDPEQRVQFHQIVQNLSGKQTVIMSSHLLNEVMSVATRALVLSQGRLILDREFTPGDRSLLLERELLDAIIGNVAADHGMPGEPASLAVVHGRN